jgi:hypothetical protein
LTYLQLHEGKIMGIATHLGPWLLGTNRYTTGTAAADTRNTGATQVVQTKAVAFNDADATNAFVIPAGSLLVDIRFITTTTFDAATTITLSIGATAITGALTVTSPGVYNFVAATTEAAAALWANTGTTDKFVTYTVAEGASTAGVGVIVAEYVVRNADGTMYQAAGQI